MTASRPRSLVASLAVVLAASMASAQPRRNNPRPPAAVELVDVTVRAGETCAAIARRVFRNPARTDVIHQYNPTVCPAQRRLTTGMVLRLPRRLPPQRGPVPVAFLTVVNNAVEVQTLPTAQPRPGQANDSLFRGTRVSTEARSSAELSFADDTQLRLYESTLVVILGDTSTRVRRTATARDTTLVSGSLRAFLGSLANGPTAATTPPVVAAPVPRRPVRPRRVPPRRPTQVAINTPGGRATLRDGESQLTIEAGARASTTLTVYRGSGQLRSGAQTVTVPEGFGARAAAGERIAPVHRLPLAPRWIERPARLLLAEGDRAIEGRYAAGEPGAPPGAPEPAEWRVQIARDAAFTAIAADARVPVAVDRLAVPAVPSGNYFVRVSAFDAEHFEGPFSDVAPVSVVVPRLTDTDRPYQQTLVLPADVRCALDGAALDTTTSTLVDRLREHTLRCGAESVGDDAAQTTLAAVRRSPYRVTATLSDADASARRGQVRLRVVDQRDVPYAGASLRVEARNGSATADGARPGATAGDWVVPVRWDPGATSLRLRLAPDGAEALDTDAISLPPSPVVTRTEGLAQRVSVRGEGLYANMLSEYQRNASASAYMGNVKAITHGIAGSLRVGFDLRRPAPGEAGAVLGLEAITAGVIFPREAGAPGVATLVGAGLRFTVRNGAVQPWASAAGAVVFTGGLLRFGVDAGLGVDFRLSRAVSLGPVVRYVHVLELNEDPLAASLDEDARVLQVGLGLTLRFPSAR